MTNKNFAKYISETQIEYAPNSFKTETGIIINPPKEIYLAKGYYEVIDIQPDPDPNCFVKFDSYSKDDEAKTITSNYIQQMIPIVREVNTYSKMKLEMAVFQHNLTDAFDCFIDTTMLSNDFGAEIPLRRLYDQAQELKDDNIYFETYYKVAKEKMGLDDKTARKILEECKIED